MCNESETSTAWSTPAVNSPPDLLAINKPLLFAALAAAGASFGTVVYEGYGDSGQTETILIEDADQSDVEGAADAIVEIHRTCSEYREGAWHFSVELESMSLSQALDEFATEAVEKFHGGFENGSGGGGEVKFDVVAGTVLIEHRDDYTASDYTDTEI